MQVFVKYSGSDFYMFSLFFMMHFFFTSATYYSNNMVMNKVLTKEMQFVSNAISPITEHDHDRDCFLEVLLQP